MSIQESIDNTLKEIDFLLKNIQESMHFPEAVSKDNQSVMRDYLVIQLSKDKFDCETLKNKYLNAEKLKNDDPDKLSQLTSLQRIAYGMAGSFKNNKLLISNKHIGNIDKSTSILNITVLDGDEKETLKSAFNNVYLAMARIDPALQAEIDKMNAKFESERNFEKSEDSDVRKRDATHLYDNQKTHDDEKSQVSQSADPRRKVKVDYSKFKKE